MRPASKDLKPGDVISSPHYEGRRVLRRRPGGWELEDLHGFPGPCSISDSTFDHPANEWTVVPPADEVTITVSRQDLEDVLYFARFNAQTGSFKEKIGRIEAAIPAPPWEPSDEQISAFVHVFGGTTAYAANKLKQFHAAGLVLP